MRTCSTALSCAEASSSFTAEVRARSSTLIDATKPPTPVSDADADAGRATASEIDVTTVDAFLNICVYARDFVRGLLHDEGMPLLDEYQNMAGRHVPVLRSWL
jgi:hypothetical protein